MTDRIDEPRTDDDGFELQRQLDAHGVPPPEDGAPTDVRPPAEAAWSASVRTTTAPPATPVTYPDRVADADDDIPDAEVELEADPPGDREATVSASWFERAWRRVLRRPIAWSNRPWPNERIIRLFVTIVVLSSATGAMMNVVHFNPLSPGDDLVFDNTTPTGGDFGAHVWGPAYLRDHLLGGFRFNGWSMDWYAGMPAYRFYMVLPAIAILIADVVLPYGVAMKLVSILGLITLPAACWAFGRLANFRYPIPELMAFGGLAFALDESFSIYGGNLKSTMAGEFSFSIALSLGVLALGLLAAGLRTGKYRVWTAVLIAAACVAHGIVLIYVVVAALIFCLVWLDRTRAIYAVTTGLTALLLTMWWTGPFLLDHEYMTDMKYGALTDWWTMYFPLTAPLDFIITSLAIFGFLMSIVRRQLNGVALGIIGIVFAAGVYFAQWSLPVIGLLWNPRVLPFFYLVRYLLMVIGGYELLNLFWNAVRDRRALSDAGTTESSVFAGIGVLAIALVLLFTFQRLPGGGNEVQADGGVRYSWGPITATATNADAQGDGWSRYNFEGYEGRREHYTEYHQVVTTMESVGDNPEYGCGRALWENSPDNGLYGTTMALMLLPFWTDGCIGSMEGLFFEASGTTPYHFLTTAAMSKQSSNPVRELRYTNNDASVGVRHLQDLGVRYVMVRSPEAKAQAQSRPELTLIASSQPWDIYLVAGSDIVVPLTTQPVVVNGRGGDARERNLELGTSWFQQPEEWAAMPADDGPASWQRIDVAIDLSRRVGEPGDSGRQVDIVVPAQSIEPVPLAPVTVSNVEVGQQSLSFDVDQVGVPVLVRVSYFPNWEATGADGPYRVGANMMVVVPESTTVELSYGRSAIDYITILLTLVGIGLCVLWRRQGDVVHAGEVPATLLAVDERVDDIADDPAGESADGPADTARDGDQPELLIWQRVIDPDPTRDNDVPGQGAQPWPPVGPDVRSFPAAESPPDDR